MKFFSLVLLVCSTFAFADCPEGTTYQCETSYEQVCGYSNQYSCDYEYAYNPSTGQYEYFNNCGYKNVYSCNQQPVEHCSCVSPHPQNERTSRGECTSSFWCIGFNEHCVNGQCVQKDIFNRCITDFDCSIFDRCSNGVCVPK